MNRSAEQIQKKPHRIVKSGVKVLIAVAVVLLCAALAVLLYISDYYRADDFALEMLRHPADGVTITESKKQDRIHAGASGGRPDFLPRRQSAI